jgi:hypothetical protein
MIHQRITALSFCILRAQPNGFPNVEVASLWADEIARILSGATRQHFSFRETVPQMGNGWGRPDVATFVTYN